MCVRVCFNPSFLATLYSIFEWLFATDAFLPILTGSPLGCIAEVPWFSTEISQLAFVSLGVPAYVLFILLAWLFHWRFYV